MTMSQPPRRHRVVIIGSGFGGLFAARALKDAPVDVTLIARTTHHLFQPLLYQVATGILSEGEVAPADAGDPQAAAERDACCSATSPTSTSRRSTVTSVASASGRR